MKCLTVVVVCVVGHVQLDRATQVKVLETANAALRASAGSGSVDAFALPKLSATALLSIVGGVTQQATADVVHARRRVLHLERQLRAASNGSEHHGRLLAELTHHRRELAESVHHARRLAEASSDAVDDLSGAVMRGAAPGEPATILTSPSLSLGLSRTDPAQMAGSEAAMSGGGGVGFSPSVASLMAATTAGNSGVDVGVDVRTKSYSTNPFAWAASASSVSAPVFSVSISTTNGSEVAVENQVRVVPSLSSPARVTGPARGLLIVMVQTECLRLESSRCGVMLCRSH